MMKNDHKPNCCTICNRPLNEIDTEFLFSESHVFEREECPHCGIGCYLSVDKNDQTVTYDCCYCHRQP